MDREAAWLTVQEFVKAPGLQKHMLAVEAAMRWYAEQLGGDAESWGLAGLLHDFDWEIHPTLEQHPADGAAILRERGLDEDIIRTILSHNTEGTDVERETARDYALLACDEITGLISAAALIRPSKDVRDVPLKSVRKRWKQRAFAAGVDREHVEEVTADFSRECFDGKLELWQHAGNVLAAMQGIAAELELDGRMAK
ncbi:MAG: HDIG domain-containing protein [Acidobacteriota bacterium]|nr:HDIG domain-containing protein [Acidobacteriota bacterium]MDE2924338.1 HDIG domain-containing protein [Acidobacteriota bacterium]MDE3263988.1 HDIG domain-containing protein [Acidobacteriota bacterium]